MVRARARARAHQCCMSARLLGPTYHSGGIPNCNTRGNTQDCSPPSRDPAEQRKGENRGGYCISAPGIADRQSLQPPGAQPASRRAAPAAPRATFLTQTDCRRRVAAVPGKQTARARVHAWRRRPSCTGAGGRLKAFRRSRVGDCERSAALGGAPFLFEGARAPWCSHAAAPAPSDVGGGAARRGAAALCAAAAAGAAGAAGAGQRHARHSQGARLSGAKRAPAASCALPWGAIPCAGASARRAHCCAGRCACVRSPAAPPRGAALRRPRDTGLVSPVSWGVNVAVCRPTRRALAAGAAGGLGRCSHAAP